MKNINEIKGLKSVEKVQAVVDLHRRHGCIYFYLLSQKDNSVTIKTIQKKSPNGNHSNIKRLVEITKEFFTPFLPKDTIIIVRPVKYVPAPSEVVNSDWLLEKMNKLKVSNKSLVSYLGIEKAEISAMINGHTKIGTRSKSAFYYFFKWFELENSVKL